MKRHIVTLAMILVGVGATTQSGRATTFVNVTQVHSESAQEVGADEIYLRIDGVMSHLGNFYQGTTKTVDVKKWSNSPINVQLWESDGDHWYDGDDFIGQHTFNNMSNGSGTWRWVIGGTCCTPPTIYHVSMRACQTGTANCPSVPIWLCPFIPGGCS
jgi:hypothetical protein